MRAEDIQGMVSTPGFYLVGDTASPGVQVLMVSRDGKIYALKLDQELALDRFTPGAFIHSCLPNKRIL